MTERRVTLEDAISAIEDSISDTVADISKTEHSMQEKNSRIDEYDDLSLALSVRIKKNRSTILSYLANIYSESNLIFNDENKIDIFQTLIMTDGDTDALSKDIIYKSLVSVLGQKFIEDYKSLVKEYDLIQIRIRDEVALLAVDQSLLERQKANLIYQRDYREKLLTATKGQEALYTQYIDSQVQMQERVEQSWKDAANAYTLSLDKLLEKNDCKKDGKTGMEIEKCNSILSFYKNERALKKIEIST